jgi:hypothetical protein
MNTTESEETLAAWAVEAAMNGLPEAEARELVEGDRYPEPEASDWEGTLESHRDDEGRLVVQDPDRDGAWIRSDVAVDLVEDR